MFGGFVGKAAGLVASGLVGAVNAAGLLVSAGGALSPVVAAILHNVSSVAVVATAPG